MIRGLCVDALNGPPSVRQLRNLGVNGVRMVAFDDEAFYDYYTAVSRAGFQTAVVLARESFSTDDYASEAADYGRALSDPLPIFVVGNEQDAGLLDADSPSSWSMDPSQYADLFRRCAAGILEVQPLAQLVIGGFVAGQPAALGDYLEAIRKVYSGPIHGYDVHPYTKDATAASYLLALYAEYAEPDMHAYVLEWHRPPREIKGYVRMLDRDTDGWAFFCAGDWNVDGFGLWNRRGKPKAAHRELRAALKGAPA